MKRITIIAGLLALALAAVAAADNQTTPIGPDTFKATSYGTVIDQTTGQEWQQSTSGPLHYQDAAGYCANLNLGGHHDWRLPNMYELQRLVIWGFFGDSAPATSPLFKYDPALVSSYDGFELPIWSSMANGDMAWVMKFKHDGGRAALGAYDNTLGVRCVGRR